MITVYGTVRSRALRVLWTLEELGVAYDYVQAGPHAPEVLAVSPVGKVPVMTVDGEVFTDSVAMMTYLADQHGCLTYAAGTVERLAQDSLTQFILDEFDALLWMAAKHSFVLPEERRVPEVKESLKWEFLRSQDRLDARWGDGPFLMGEVMTIADILLVHCCNWAVSAKFPLENQRLKEFAREMRARDAFKRAFARDG